MPLRRAQSGGRGHGLQPADWPWSSCRAHIGQAATPDWLDGDGLHGYLLGAPVCNAQDRRRGARLYAKLVPQPRDDDASFWPGALRGQVFLGDEQFVERMQALAAPQHVSDKAVPKAQRLRPRTWQECLARCDGERDRALLMAYRKAGSR